MMQRSSVLVPLDGSAFSQQILPSITQLFPPDKYQLILLRVVEEPGEVIRPTPAIWSSTWSPRHFDVPHEYEHNPYPASIDQIEASLRAGIEDELAPVARRLRQEGYAVATAVRFGDPADEIIAYARNQGVNFVAMATHGRSGIMHLVMGSVAEKVMCNLPIPVLLLRPSGRPVAAADQDHLN